MTPKLLVIALTALAMGGLAHAQAPANATPTSVAAKLVVRGSADKVAVREIRAVRSSEILSVQADFYNPERADQYVFYRFRWVDGVGNQVGDGEAWKQLLLLGQAQETVKSVAPTAAAVDFRIEMNAEKK